MTRKDYIVLARALANSRPRENPDVALEHDLIEDRRVLDGQWAAWRQCVCAVAGELADDNPRFRRADFYAACLYFPRS